MTKTIFDIMSLSEWRQEWRCIRSLLKQNLAPDTERVMLENVLLRKRVEQLENENDGLLAAAEAAQWEVFELMDRDG